MRSPDPLLQILVGNLELIAKDTPPPPKIPIQICIGGAVIVGELISSLDFEKESHRISKLLCKIHDDAILDTAVKWQTTCVDVAGKLPEFLHLRGVEFWPHNLTVDGDKPPSTDLWRFRISSIDGFHIYDSYDSESGT